MIFCLHNDNTGCVLMQFLTGRKCPKASSNCPCFLAENTDSYWKPWDTDFSVQSRNEADKNSAKIVQKISQIKGGR